MSNNDDDPRVFPFATMTRMGDAGRVTLHLRRKPDGSIHAYDQDGAEVPQGGERFRALNVHVLGCSDCQLPDVQPGGPMQMVALCEEAHRLMAAALGG